MDTIPYVVGYESRGDTIPYVVGYESRKYNRTNLYT